MVNTRSAGPTDDQATGSTVQPGTAGDDSTRDVVAETPQDGPPPKTTTQDEGNANDQLIDDDDDQIGDPIYTPDSLVHEDQDPDDDDAADAQIEEEIARLKKQKHRATIRSKLNRLREQATHGFVHDDKDMGLESFKQRLALERAKTAREPDLYSGDNQRTLDDFFQQLDLVFKTKPFTYWLEADKCTFAAGRLSGIPSQEWRVEERRIVADSEQTLTYQGFKSFLQERLLPKHIRTANLTLRIYTTRQRSNQSVAELVAYLNELENQFDPPLIDRERRNNLFVAIHKHIRRKIIEQNRSWSTRVELEQVASSLESSLVPPEGIKVRKGYASLSTTTGRSTVKPAPHAGDRGKTAAHNVVGYATRKHKPETRPPSGAKAAKQQRTGPRPGPRTTPRAPSKALVPASNAPTDYSTYECYNCRQKGHISKNCTQPKTRSEKVQGQ